MILKSLNRVYSVKEFKQKGHELIDNLSKHIGQVSVENLNPVINWVEPNESLSFWKDFLENGSSESPS